MQRNLGDDSSGAIVSSTSVSALCVNDDGDRRFDWSDHGTCMNAEISGLALSLCYFLPMNIVSQRSLLNPIFQALAI
jgi:hypothetical protein